ncbi:hypothetical protein [Methanocella sp. MCL-LM]|uniref:hypothetical protein n=1 Tax=Methanocella sp. MCL-LM TaxID=3412035 RepID=UPI003C730660
MEKEVKDLKQMFMQKKPCLIFLAISRVEKPYVSTLMKEADTTFAHTTNILSDMEACGLVEFVAEGRVKHVKLTKRGKEVSKALMKLEGILGGENLLHDLKTLEKRVNGLETRIKAGGLDERAVRRAMKSLSEVAVRTGAIEGESKLFSNEKLVYEIRVMKERLEYLETKLQPVQSDD